MGLWVGHLAGDQGTGFNPNSLSFCPLSAFLATPCAVCLQEGLCPFTAVCRVSRGVVSCTAGSLCAPASCSPLLCWAAGGRGRWAGFLLGWRVKLIYGHMAVGEAGDPGQISPLRVTGNVTSSPPEAPGTAAARRHTLDLFYYLIFVPSSCRSPDPLLPGGSFSGEWNTRGERIL